MPPLTLTPTERLVLANQFQILVKLDPDGKMSYERMLEIVEQGYQPLYCDLFAGINEDELTEEQFELVQDILEMHWDMWRSYHDLEDKSGIDENDLQVVGFDGNNEWELLSFAKYWTERRGKFEGLRVVNSHSISLPCHTRRLEQWPRPKTRGAVVGELSREQIRDILSA